MNNDPAWGEGRGHFHVAQNSLSIRFSKISDFSIQNELIVRLMTHVDEKSRKSVFLFGSPGNSPVVKAGVHSCSPVAPHSSVFDGVVVTEVANGEFIIDVFRLRLTVGGSGRLIRQLGTD